jgi:hypothetical protein
MVFIKNELMNKFLFFPPLVGRGGGRVDKS